MRFNFNKVNANMSVLKETLEKLLAQTEIPYCDATPATFPENKGVYVITSSDGTILRAGKTGLGKATLRQRLYQNHLMGTQGGNLPAQLVGSRECPDLISAKHWIRKFCSVRFLPIDDDLVRSRTEHFILAVLEPRFCDNNNWD